jgi:acyl-CoA thioester hydrolase
VTRDAESTTPALVSRLASLVSPMSDDLSDFPLVVRTTVLWSDLDAYGHLNNAVFFRYFEQARMEYLARCLFIESYEKDKIGAILHSTTCRFRRPVFHPDTVEVGTRVTETGEDRFTMEYVARSTAQGAVAAEGTAVVVSYDYKTGQKAPIPSAVRAAMQAVQGHRPPLPAGERVSRSRSSAG